MVGWARRRQTVAGVGEQMAREVDWTHHESNAGGGAAIGDAGERRRWDRGGAPASARIPAKGGPMQVNKWPWELY
jgi:hypothetical protein